MTSSPPTTFCPQPWRWRSIYNAAESSVAQALDEIAVRTAVTDHHPDARDGGRSFREKRAPKFNAWLDGEGADPH